jgi:hypothetical protein
MAEREAGSWIEDNGQVRPNENDEAMAERLNLKKDKKKDNKEVTTDGGHGKAGE